TGWSVAAISSVLLGMFVIGPVVRVIDSQRWPQHTCQVIRSAARTHSEGKGATFSVDILYSYTIDGRRLQPDRFGLFPPPTAGFASCQRLVDQFVPGKRLVCYVNPDDPEDAVLVRGASVYFLLGLVPVILLAGGLLLANLPGGQAGASLESSPAPLRVRVPAA